MWYNIRAEVPDHARSVPCCRTMPTAIPGIGCLSNTLSTGGGRFMISSKTVPHRTVIVDADSGEVWRPVVGHEGRYEVSNHGRVRGPRGSVLLPRRNTRGYAIVSLSTPQGTKTKPIHVLVMAAFVGPRPDGWHINHLDGWRMNARLDNLEYCSPEENARHMRALKRQRSPRAAERGRIAHPVCPICAGIVRVERIGEAFQPVCSCGWAGETFRQS